MFILFSTPSGIEFRSVNHTSIHEDSELNLFKTIQMFSENTQ